MNEIRLFRWELDSMPEYSCSIPSETVLWKMWKCDRNAYNPRKVEAGPLWYVGQYASHPRDPENLVSIWWFKVKLVEGPKPKDWRAPDWHNHQRWERERAGARVREKCAC